MAQYLRRRRADEPDEPKKLEPGTILNMTPEQVKLTESGGDLLYQVSNPALLTLGEQKIQLKANDRVGVYHGGENPCGWVLRTEVVDGDMEVVVIHITAKKGSEILVKEKIPMSNRRLQLEDFRTYPDRFRFSVRDVNGRVLKTFLVAETFGLSWGAGPLLDDDAFADMAFFSVPRGTRVVKSRAKNSAA